MDGMKLFFFRWKFFFSVGLLMIALFPFAAYSICIGNDYDQHLAPFDVELPKVTIENIPSSIEPGEIISLAAKEVIDSRGYPAFYWCVNSGHFLYDSDSPDFRTVKFVAPLDSGNTVKLYVRLSDGLGYVHTKEIIFDVLMPTTIILDKNIGKLGVTPPDGSSVDLTTSGTILLDGQPIQANWTSNGITFNFYEVTGKTFDSFWQPVELEIHDTNGQEIYSGCYPFKDVCVGSWYTRPVMKLWKEGIIQGYGNGKSGVFSPHNSTLRAELVAATVRAKELGNTPAPLTVNPFVDVNINDWFATYVQYAKDTGLVQGCDPDNNLFCPVDPISRAAGTKVVVAAFLNDTLAAFENGEQPPRLFLDINDQNEWYYPYIYAAEVEKVVGGYSDGNFKPEQTMTRAEMAKIICLAAFGAEECSDMGEITGRPFIFAVTPEIATLNEPTVFTVVGLNLSDAIDFELADCANVTPIAGGTAEERLFQCTPSNTGGAKDGVLEYGANQTVFTVNVQEQVAPKVTSVTPLTATLNQQTTFTVIGSDLPDNLAFWIANCDGVTALSRSPEQQQFQCTPTNGATGSQQGIVKDASGANQLKVFFVDVVAPVSEPPIEPPPTDEPPVDEPPVDEPPVDEPPIDEPPVDEPPVDEPPPDTGCTPSVDRVSPLTATIDESVTFTVYGSCLPEATAFFVGRCKDVTALGGTETRRQFRCVPSYSVGIQDDGVVKDKSGGTVLDTFSVNVEWGTPRVTSVTPTSANLDEPTEFIVRGTSLTDEIAFWIGECEGMEVLYRETEEQKFRCTPSWTTGTKEGIVKDKSGGDELYPFSVHVY